MTQYIIKRLDEITRENSKAKTQGVLISDSLAVSATTDLDWKFPEERWITGGVILAVGSWGSNVTLQIVDKDNVLGYGANTVLDEFVTTFYISNTDTKQIEKEFNYPALIPANIYIRLRYQNTSSDTLGKAALNIFSHIPRS